MAATQTLLDLAFAMDCTGSMSSYIDQAQQNIKKIVEEIVSKEKADVRLAMIEYRDHPPQEATFVTRVKDFTPSVREMKQTIDDCSAAGGGDTPEAVADALHALLKLDWRPASTKICVFIADAPPHALGCGGDGFPEGCPCGLDPMATTREIAEKGITLYMVGCEPAIIPYKEWFMSIAHLTGGKYIPLGAAHLLTRVIIGGAQEEISLQQLMAEVNQNVQAQTVGDGEVDIEELEKTVFEDLKSKGRIARTLTSDIGDLPVVTPMAVTLSNAATMLEVRSQFKPMDGMSVGAGASRGARYDPPPRSTVSEYHNVDRDVSYEQCSRMVQKSIATNKLKGKVSENKYSKRLTE